MISPGSSNSGSASRGRVNPVGVVVVPTFARAVSQRVVTSAANARSVRARRTCSETDWP